MIHPVDPDWPRLLPAAEWKSLPVPYDAASACAYCRAFTVGSPQTEHLVCECEKPCAAGRCSARLNLVRALAPEPAAGKCPGCPALVGSTHYPSCSILYEALADPARPEPAMEVYPADILAAGCGCPAVLVAARGREGHKGCPRTYWVTPVDEPDEDVRVGGWCAAFADLGVSLNLIRPAVPPHSTGSGFHMVRGFAHWTAAARWLDTLPRVLPGATPLGVFAELDHVGAHSHVSMLRMRLLASQAIADAANAPGVRSGEDAEQALRDALDADPSGELRAAFGLAEGEGR